MRTYELLYIIDGGKTEPEAAKVTDEVGAKLLSLGGKAKEQNVLGRKRLAYAIGKQDHGWYVLLHLEIDAAKANDFVKQLNVMNEVVRTVLVAAEEVPKPGEIVQTPTAVEESKEAAKVTVPEALRKSAKPVAGKAEEAPAADTTPAEDTDDEAEKKPAAEKKASAKDLEAALAEQLKDS
ncbi:MAG TPA: 30S ribosomal protein S6 [Patescibacteria group bacterium]|jgi:small subunit ribosomal protein S6